MVHTPLVEFDASIPLSEPYDIRCGNSKFSDNIWDFNGYVESNHLSGARLMIKFDAFQHKENLLEVVKLFVFYELIENKFTTAKRNYDGLKRFIKFVNEKMPELESFSEVTRTVLTNYYEYLFATKNEITKKPLKPTGIKKAAYAIKEVLLRGSVREWDVPEESYFAQVIYDEMIINNNRLKKQEKASLKKVKDRVIDEDVIDKVLQTAVSDLEKGENILTAASVLITSQIGMRISELVGLEEDCIQQIDGDKMLTFKTFKLNQEPINTYKPTNELILFAIEKLKEYTTELRKESGLPYLFLSRHKGRKGSSPVIMSYSNYNKNYLGPWIKKHNITNKEGKLVDFTSHTFRHAFATYSLRQGASIDVISKILNHKTIRGTEHYTHFIEEDVKKRFAEVMSEGAIISGKKALTIQDKLKENNPFKGKASDEVDKLRKAMKIQVLSHGLCLHHPMRNEPCEGDGVCLGCNNYITTPEFLDVHKGRLDRVRNELSRVEGKTTNGPFESKLKHIESNLVKIINDLETKLEK